MNGSNRTKAIVIGAGIGGLSTAIGLRRIGMDVTVYERMPELREVGSGLTLWVNAMRALEKLGAADEIRSRGARVDEIANLTWQGKTLKTLPISRIGDKYDTPSYSIHRGELQSGLAKVLGTEHVEVGAQLTGFSQDASGVTARFADGREERGDLLVGADGINSAVRAQMVGKSEPRYSGYTCWRSAVKLEHELLPPTRYIQVYGPRSNFGVFPIGPHHWSWYATQMTPPTAAMAVGPERKQEALEVFRDWCDPVPAVIEATDDGGVVRQDISDRRPIEEWANGRVVLVGDAAHPTTPALGQGGCMAIEDAVVLAKELCLGDDIAAGLNRFVRTRRGRANGIVRQAHRHGAFYHGRNKPLAAVRDWFLGNAPTKIAMSEVDKLMGYEA
jgi:2-polyprenyl-6-methoxyphenol hydroxylase-like FAD-dependent oxidoreductase